MQWNSSFLRCHCFTFTWAPGQPCMESHVQLHLGGSCRGPEPGDKADTGWDSCPRERERSASFILIPWELIALKAQVSHIPAAKTKASFYLNRNQKTGAYLEGQITELLNSKRISSQAGPHLKHHKEGPFIYGKKNYKETLMLHWQIDKLQLFFGSNTFTTLTVFVNKKTNKNAEIGKLLFLSV